MSKSIVKSLFVNRANAINADIVKNHEQIISECMEFNSIISACHETAQKESKNPHVKAGTDAIREAVVNSNFTWLYDEMGKPNKKGIAKPTMGSNMRKIREGMLFIASDDNADLFIAWANSDNSKSQGITDFANIKKVIKPKPQKTEIVVDETGADETGADETETASNETEKNAMPSLADIAKKLVADLGKKEANKLSILIAELVEDDLSDADIEKMVANM
jgi:hypothetical protein